MRPKSDYWFLAIGLVILCWALRPAWSETDFSSLPANEKFESLIADLKQKSRDIKEQNNIQSAKNEIIHKKLWRLQQELKSKFIEKQALEAEFHRLDDCLKEEITIVELLDKKLNGLHAILSHHDERKDQLNADIAKKRKNLAVLRTEVEELTGSILTSENQLRMTKNNDIRALALHRKIGRAHV